MNHRYNRSNIDQFSSNTDDPCLYFLFSFGLFRCWPWLAAVVFNLILNLVWTSARAGDVLFIRVWRLSLRNVSTTSAQDTKWHKYAWTINRCSYYCITQRKILYMAIYDRKTHSVKDNQAMNEYLGKQIVTLNAKIGANHLHNELPTCSKTLRNKFSVQADK